MLLGQRWATLYVWGPWCHWPKEFQRHRILKIYVLGISTLHIQCRWANVGPPSMFDGDGSADSQRWPNGGVLSGEILEINREILETNREIIEINREIFETVECSCNTHIWSCNSCTTCWRSLTIPMVVGGRGRFICKQMVPWDHPRPEFYLETTWDHLRMILLGRKISLRHPTTLQNMLLQLISYWSYV